MKLAEGTVIHQAIAALQDLEPHEMKREAQDIYDSLNPAGREALQTEWTALKHTLMDMWLALDSATMYRGYHIRNVEADIHNHAYLMTKRHRGEKL